MNDTSPKKDIPFGFASSATQCEGGELESSWIYWWGLGYIADRTAPAVAAQHWERWAEDAALLASLGVRVHRMGVDWTRIEPREGEFDQSALAHYRAELSALRRSGIAVQLELHHFTNPVWFEELGGFEREESIAYYLRYVETVVGTLGAECSEYLTFAEPNAYAFGGWLGGDYPPGKNNFSRLFAVLTNMAACHVEAYRLIHSYREAMGWGASRVSVSLRAHDIAPRGEGRLAQSGAELTRRSFFDAPFRAFYFGRSALPMKYHRLLAAGQYADFLAVDWYGRAEAAGLRDVLPCRTDTGAPFTLGALVPFLTHLHALAPLPISLTLRGLEDDARVKAVEAVRHQLGESALPVERLFYQGFTDGFEWLNGHASRRGAVAVDPESFARTVKRDTHSLIGSVSYLFR